MAVRVLLLAADQFEDMELLYPLYRLAEDGISVTVAGLDGSPVTGKKGHGPVPVDTTADQVAEADFAALVLPGGYAPDKLRRSAAVLDLVRSFDRAGKPIAFICHAGWVPISAKILKGRRATSVAAIRDDMENAGVDWVDEATVVDGNLISARTPADLGPWMKALLAALRGGTASGLASCIRVVIRQRGRSPVSVRRFLFATAALLGAVLAVAGCGAPQFRYVGSVPDKVFFQVPSSWQQLSTSEVSAFQRTVLAQNAAGPQGGQLLWSAAFDAAAHPSATHLFALTGQPIVYSSVQVMSSPVRDAMSFDFMRDLLIPVTPGRRQQLAAAGQRLPPVRVLAPPVTFDLAGGIRGIGELFSLKLSSGTEVYAQTVLTDNATSKLYLLFVQCDQTCFNAHISQIRTVVQSFTVKGP